MDKLLRPYKAKDKIEERIGYINHWGLQEGYKDEKTINEYARSYAYDITWMCIIKENCH